MANLTAQIRTTISYTGPNGESVVQAAQTTSCAYRGQNHGAVDVPDGASATVYTIPFGGVAKATLLVIRNDTGQDCGVKINGAAAVSHNLPDGGKMTIEQATLPTLVPLASCTVATLATQVGDGLISYSIFGDPV